MRTWMLSLLSLLVACGQAHTAVDPGVPHCLELVGDVGQVTITEVGCDECQRDVVFDCTATVEGDSVTLEAVLSWTTPASCSDKGCVMPDQSCEVPGLASGVWTVVYGDSTTVLDTEDGCG